MSSDESIPCNSVVFWSECDSSNMQAVSPLELSYIAVSLFWASDRQQSFLSLCPATPPGYLSDYQFPTVIRPMRWNDRPVPLSLLILIRQNK